jgi:hypothetical protein
MVDSKDNLFSHPDQVVSLLFPNLQSEGVSYKYLKELAREFVVKSTSPSELAQLVNGEISRETSRTRREALLRIRQRAIEVFALDEG